MRYRRDPTRPSIKGQVSAKQVMISLPQSELAAIDNAADSLLLCRSQFFRDAARHFTADPHKVVTICLSLTAEDVDALDAKATAANMSRSELLRAAAKHELEKGNRR